MKDTVCHKFESRIDFLVKNESSNDEFLKSLEKMCPAEIIDKEVIELDCFDAKKLSQQYQDCLKILADFEKKKEMLKQKLIDLSGGKNIKCGNLTLYSVVKKGNIDYKSIPGMQFVDIDKYRKESTQYWKINIG